MMFMMFLWFLLIVGGIAFVVWAIARRNDGEQRLGVTDEDRALVALRDRLARGEIDETEYRERRQVLERDQT